ncbi:ATP-dependent DNA helicase RecG [Paracoccaceae bacterium GXU_MW_L88]
MARPEALFPLFGDLESLPGIGRKTAEHLENLAIFKPADLAFTLPAGVHDRRLRERLADTPAGMASFRVIVLAHQKPASRSRPWRVDCAVGPDRLQIVFFHARGDWVERQLPVGAERIVSGKLEWFEGRPQIAHPDYITENEGEIPAFEPVYPLTEGVTQKTMRKAAEGVLDLLPTLPEWIAPSLKAKENWPDWDAALTAAHHPKSTVALQAKDPARRRLAYDEVFAHQLALAISRQNRRRTRGRVTVGDGHLRGKVIAALPFAPTGAQTRAVEEIAADLAAPQRMYRLLQGDVGAGKTLVAMLALLTAVEAGGQGAMMAPTEILARQHAAALAPLAEAAGVQMVTLTGRDSGRDRQEKLERIASGEAQVILGTHALFQRDVSFHDLRLAVIDEQHRFGVRQRMDLGAKGAAVDMLVMTATPIPRSLALSQYGEMDVSVLDEKPPGRQPVETVLVSMEREAQVVERLRAAISGGAQIYWVCPLVEESEVMDLKSVEDRARVLRKALGEEAVGLVHGQMLPEARDTAMADFKAGRTRLLVATTVIEVGVDVPNATIMVIENAEHFGLAQLHQLRGRVGRGSEKSTCLLLYAPPLGKTAEARLKALRETEDGFRIAETDLKLRGAGDLLGVAQSGLPRFRIADIEADAALMALAQSDSRALLESDPNLTSDRGEAARYVLYLFSHDESFRFLSVG